MKKYKVIVSDPPWLFGDSLPGETRGASNNYPCMTIEQLKKFELPPLDDDCVLFQWRVSSMVPEAYEVTKAWGFNYKTELVWKKLTKNGKRWFGMGRTLRAEHESCIIAVRGKPQVKVKNIRSVFEAVCEGHSRKPKEFYKIVEELYDGPYCEIFSRENRPNWDCFGNEVGKFDIKK